MAQTDKKPISTSRVLARILDHRQHIDYLLLAAFAAHPFLVAYWVGIFHDTSDGILGYWERDHWRALVLALPLTVFAARWVTTRVGPVSPIDLPSPAPPVIDLVRTKSGKVTAYANYRAAILSRKNLYAAVLVTLTIQLADTAQLTAFYLSDVERICTAGESSDATCAVELDSVGDRARIAIILGGQEFQVEKDWSVAYLSAEKKTSKWQNLLLNLSAYSIQASAIFVGILLIVLTFRHNLFFLLQIYQRRRESSEHPSWLIHIDLFDKEHCFGFRAANAAFNVQVLGVAIAAAIVLTTRFANVKPGTGLFPDLGQWLALFGLLAAMLIVSMPILVKLLPRFPFPDIKMPEATRVAYLREFLSDEAWSYKKNTSKEEIDAAASLFAKSDFWPTGNNRAAQLYFVLFWVFFIAVVPDPRAIPAMADFPEWSRYFAWVVSGILAALTTWTLFQFLRQMLIYVDKSLVEPKVNLPLPLQAKAPANIFISYRRADTGGYAGRLYDTLCDHFLKEGIFLDHQNIHRGAKYLELIYNAIDYAQVMLVVVGPDWLTVKDNEDKSRLMDSEDIVHQEIRRGLERNIHVVPVLVGGAAMPQADDLPEGLKGLSDRNACEISNTRWEYDVNVLVDDLKSAEQIG